MDPQSPAVLSPEEVTALLDSIPGALDDARQGLRDAEEGRAQDLDEFAASDDEERRAEGG